MAVELIFTVASRRFRIFGSGTCSTRTSFLPYQHVALITRLLSRSRVAARLRRPLFHITGARDRGVRYDDFARLHHLFESPQVVVQLLLRRFTKELGNGRADEAARRAVLDLHADDRAASSRRALEAHR